MSVRSLDNFQVNIARGLRQGDNEIALRRGDAILLNAVGVGNHIYLTLRDRVKSEVVRYDHVEDWDTTDPSVVMVPVTRNVSGTGARSFAFGTCLTGEVTSFYLRDLVAEMGGGGGVDCASVQPPPSSESAEIPTTMFGARSALLGQPAGFMEICPGRIVPYYSR